MQLNFVLITLKITTRQMDVASSMIMILIKTTIVDIRTQLASGIVRDYLSVMV